MQALIPFWQTRLPERSKMIISSVDSVIGAQGGELDCSTCIFAIPEPNHREEGLNEQEMLYRVATGLDNRQQDEEPFGLIIRGRDAVQIASFIRSLC